MICDLSLYCFRSIYFSAGFSCVDGHAAIRPPQPGERLSIRASAMQPLTQRRQRIQLRMLFRLRKYGQSRQRRRNEVLPLVSPYSKQLVLPVFDRVSKRCKPSVFRSPDGMLRIQKIITDLFSIDDCVFCIRKWHHLTAIEFDFAEMFK